MKILRKIISKRINDVSLLVKRKKKKRYIISPFDRRRKKSFVYRILKTDRLIIIIIIIIVIVLDSNSCIQCHFDKNVERKKKKILNESELFDDKFESNESSR